YIREAARVLEPGGWFHFQVNDLPPATPTPLARLRAALGRARRRITGAPGPRGLDSPAWRGSRLRLADAVAACQAAGLTIERTHGAGTQYLWITARKPA